MKKVLLRSSFISLLVLSFVSFDLLGQAGILRKADQFYYNKAYKPAIELYLKALYRKDNEVAMLKLADSYRLTSQPEQSAFWYEKAVNSEYVHPIHMLHYAEILMMIQDYENASNFLLKYLKLEPKDHRAEELLQSCKYASKEMNLTVDYRVIPMTFNSDFTDLGPCFFKDQLLISSARSNKFHVNREFQWMQEPFLDVYILEDDGSGVLGRLELFDHLNSKYHDAQVAYCEKSQEIFVTRNNLSFGNSGTNDKGFKLLKIYYTKRDTVKNKWSKLKEWKYNSSEYSTGHPAISQDGLKLIFTSDKPGGVGGSDLYISERQSIEDEWQEPVSLTGNVNSEGNEGFSYLDSEGILYFASDGHEGFGGLDVYSVDLSIIGSPLNHLKYPINTSYDDYGFITKDKGHTGYFVSNRSKGNDDIFKFYKTSSLFKESKDLVTVCYDIESTDKPCYSFESPLLSEFWQGFDFVFEWDFGYEFKKYGQQVHHCYSEADNNQVDLTLKWGDTEEIVYEHQKDIDDYSFVKGLDIHIPQRVLLSDTAIMWHSLETDLGDKYDFFWNIDSMWLQGDTLQYQFTEEGNHSIKITSDSTETAIDGLCLLGNTKAFDPTVHKTIVNGSVKYLNVFDSIYYPVVDADINIVATDNSIFKENIVSDSIGKFSFELLRNQEVELSIAKDGFSEDFIKVNSFDGAAEKTIEVYLEKYTPQVLIVEVLDADNETSLIDASIKLTDAKRYFIDEFISKESSSSFSIYRESSYQLVVAKDGYFNKAIKVRQDAFADTIIERVSLKIIEINKPIVLENIYYDFGKWGIRDDAIPALKDLLKILKDNPNIDIELSAHTDNTGAILYNDFLSEQRASSVKDYLVENGINETRIIARGYGEREPIAPNELENGKDNPEGRQLNRRTEFKVINENKSVSMKLN